jgi:hypothetical protein
VPVAAVVVDAVDVELVSALSSVLHDAATMTNERATTTSTPRLSMRER